MTFGRIYNHLILAPTILLCCWFCITCFIKNMFSNTTFQTQIYAAQKCSFCLFHSLWLYLNNRLRRKIWKIFHLALFIACFPYLWVKEFSWKPVIILYFKSCCYFVQHFGDFADWKKLHKSNGYLLFFGPQFSMWNQQDMGWKCFKVYLHSFLIFLSKQILMKTITTKHSKNVNFSLYSQGFQAYIHKTHMHIDNFLRFFVVQFRKSWKLFSSIGNLLPPSCSAFNTRRGQDFFRPFFFFFRMHHKKRAAPSQRYWGKVTFDQWHQLQSYIWEKEVVLLL